MRNPLCCALTAGVLAFAAALPASAFEGYEHKHLGDVALRIAADMAGENLRGRAWWTLFAYEKCLLVPAMRLLPGGEQHCLGHGKWSLTYGEIVRLVDYMDHPQQLFSYSPALHSQGTPRSMLDLNHRMIEDARREGLTLNAARAATTNDSHFQGALLGLLTRLHAEAVRLANDQEWFAALLTNALADHFLQDFFAPGHITTTRENSHDVVALSMHDAANRKGANFRIDSHRWKELKPILDFVRTYHQSYELFLAPKPGLAEFMRRETVQSAEYVTPPAYLDDEAELKVIADLEINHRHVRLVGDDLLGTQPRQQLFVLLVAVRGLLDVLIPQRVIEDDGRAVDRNSLAEYDWQGRYDSATIEATPVRARIAYGAYEIDDDLLSSASNVVVLSFGGQAPIDGGGSSRISAALELIPLGLIGNTGMLRDRLIQKATYDCGFLSLCNLAPILGVALVSDDDFSAIGPSVRITKAFPKIQAQLGAYYEALKFSGPDPAWKSSWGFRFDLGFGIYSAYIKVGRSYFLNADNHLEPDGMFSFGGSIGIPYSRMF